MQEINGKDWKLFRQRLPEWQEAYIQKLNREYIAILSREGSAAENFWEVQKRIREDKRSVGVIADMRKSMFWINMIRLLRQEVITLDDLDGFSEELVGKLRMIFERENEYGKLCD